MMWGGEAESKGYPQMPQVNADEDLGYAGWFAVRAEIGVDAGIRRHDGVDGLRRVSGQTVAV